jgi:uncharacterized protein YkwD
MQARARTRRFVALSSTVLAGVALAAVPAVALSNGGPLPAAPVPLPPLPGATVPTAPVASATGRCRGAGARPGRVSAGVLRSAVLCLINQQRARDGRSAFSPERHLARAASRHAADMGRRHYFAHVSPSGKSPAARARAAGWHGNVGEIIAWGCGTRATPRATIRAWLHSPPHRAIMLGGGRVAGVGVKRLAGCGGRAYFVVDVG